jgi:hypothetical protein
VGVLRGPSGDVLPSAASDARAGRAGELAGLSEALLRASGEGAGSAHTQASAPLANHAASNVAAGERVPSVCAKAGCEARERFAERDRGPYVLHVAVAVHVDGCGTSEPRPWISLSIGVRAVAAARRANQPAGLAEALRRAGSVPVVVFVTVVRRASGGVGDVDGSVAVAILGATSVGSAVERRRAVVVAVDRTRAAVTDAATVSVTICARSARAHGGKAVRLRPARPARESARARRARTARRKALSSVGSGHRGVGGEALAHARGARRARATLAEALHSSLVRSEAGAAKRCEGHSSGHLRCRYRERKRGPRRRIRARRRVHHLARVRAGARVVAHGLKQRAARARVRRAVARAHARPRSARENTGDAHHARARVPRVGQRDHRHALAGSRGAVCVRRTADEVRKRVWHSSLDDRIRRAVRQAIRRAIHGDVVHNVSGHVHIYDVWRAIGLRLRGDVRAAICRRIRSRVERRVRRGIGNRCRATRSQPERREQEQPTSSDSNMHREPPRRAVRRASQSAFVCIERSIEKC